MAEGRPLLLIEDDDELRDLAAALLVADGIDVVTASSGEDALAQLSAGVVPLVVVLDLHLPTISGWSVWDRLKSDETLRSVPVIVWTGTGLRQGAVGEAIVVEKTDPAALRSTVRDLWTKAGGAVSSVSVSRG